MSNTDTTHAAAIPRNIPWDCSDWQASPAVDDAEDARVSVILESLATNRGKTLYCAVDQSDTFTKTETWQAGKDRNERDDTVYYGANGRFRGFLAAQEGYLTDGESGVTGISRERIFEFPEEPRKRRRYRTVTETLPVAADNSRRVRTPLSASLGVPPVNTAALARTQAQSAYNGNRPSGFSPTQEHVSFLALAETAAANYCDAEGYDRAVDLATSSNIWEYSLNQNSNPNTWQFYARKARTWTATCERRVRKRR